MSRQEMLVVAIGMSHLFQPPITLWLAKRILDLERDFSTLPTLASRVARIMALVAIVFPTALGCLCALYPAAVLSGGPMRLVAFLLAGVLWTPRLLAQVLWVGPAFPQEARKWHLLVVSIFVLQGPAFLALLVAGAN